MLQSLKTALNTRLLNTSHAAKPGAGPEAAVDARAGQPVAAATVENPDTYEGTSMHRPDWFTRVRQECALRFQGHRAAKLRSSCGNDPLRMLEATRLNMARCP